MALSNRCSAGEGITRAVMLQSLVIVGYLIESNEGSILSAKNRQSLINRLSEALMQFADTFV